MKDRTDMNDHVGDILRRILLMAMACSLSVALTLGITSTAQALPTADGGPAQLAEPLTLKCPNWLLWFFNKYG